MLEILTLSLLQGITEFLPVSSSAHLIIFSEYFGFNNQSLSIDLSLHIGSFIAVVSYFHKDIINFIKNKELFFKILLSSAPILIVGFILVQTDLIEKILNARIVFGKSVTRTVKRKGVKIKEVRHKAIREMKIVSGWRIYDNLNKVIVDENKFTEFKEFSAWGNSRKEAERSWQDFFFDPQAPRLQECRPRWGGPN